MFKVIPKITFFEKLVGDLVDFGFLLVDFDLKLVKLVLVLVLSLIEQRCFKGMFADSVLVACCYGAELLVLSF